MIKLINIILLLLLFPRVMEAQEIPLSSEQQLENQADTEEGETEDDSWLQDLDIFKKNPININTADADELRQLRVLTDLQIANLVTYRSVLGKLQTIYELQAVPSWDVATIKKILPFVTIAGALSLKDDLLKRFSGGEHTILLRLS
ncbi:MAG TPA: helix-hairpin-helix domain-containing protein, partial [Chitinophagaceae bacterium]|nr:helix-hairpin-helix domain-containing protein [Chitinophagaceae bacterium]